MYNTRLALPPCGAVPVHTQVPSPPPPAHTLHPEAPPPAAPPETPPTARLLFLDVVIVILKGDAAGPDREYEWRLVSKGFVYK